METPLPDPRAEALKRLFEDLRDASLAKDNAKVCDILRGLMPDKERVRVAIARPDFSGYRARCQEPDMHNPDEAFEEIVIEGIAKESALAAKESESMLKAVARTLKSAHRPGIEIRAGGAGIPDNVYVRSFTQEELMLPIENTKEAKKFAKEMFLRNLIRPLRTDIMYYEAWFQPQAQQRVPFPVHLIYWDGRRWSALYQNWCNPLAPKWTSPVAFFLYHVYSFTGIYPLPGGFTLSWGWNKKNQ